MYARRAAAAYLAAYDAQGGRRRTVGCPMLAAQSKLTRVYACAGALGLETVAGEWHGDYWRRYAVAVLELETVSANV